MFIDRDMHVLARFCVGYILPNYVRLAAEKCPSLKRKHVHPHTMRHTTAMHLLQSCVDLNTVRCWLGHASVTTTNRYVETDLEMKRRALDGFRGPSGPIEPIITDAGLLAWLETF